MSVIRQCRRCGAKFDVTDPVQNRAAHDARNCPRAKQCGKVHPDGRVCVLNAGHEQHGSGCASIEGSLLVSWTSTTQNVMQRDLADLRAIRGRIDAAIIDMQSVAFNARLPEVREAVKEAVADLYFWGGKHQGKTPATLERIVALLAPEVDAVLQEEGASEAYKIVEPSSRDDEPITTETATNELEHNE